MAKKTSVVKQENVRKEAEAPKEETSEEEEDDGLFGEDGSGEEEY